MLRLLHHRPTLHGPNRGRPLSILRGLCARAQRVLRCFKAMAERHRMRRQLLELEDRMLEDIGVTREQAGKMARKPLWKP